MELLRFITAGSVDDGKSTLIGRMLFDTKNIHSDQLNAIMNQVQESEEVAYDLAKLTDGLKAEREQGITIDVAYKYFSTAKRKFIIADAPGHIQYTRNLITGASLVDAMIVLIDARNGVIEQTIRHSLVAATLKIPHVIIAINKMDIYDYDEKRFAEIKADYEAVAEKLNLKNLTFIPVSALRGDNVVQPSKNMLWYKGDTLLAHLENLPIVKHKDANTRLNVQYIIRPDVIKGLENRAILANVVSGSLQVGDAITIYPGDTSATVKSLERNGENVNEVYEGQNVIVQTNEQVDVSRGDIIALSTTPVQLNNNAVASLFWMDTKSLNEGDIFILQRFSQEVRVRVSAINYKRNVHSLEAEKVNDLQMNDIGEVELAFADNVPYDANTQENRNGFILINENTYQTVAGGFFNN